LESRRARAQHMYERFPWRSHLSLIGLDY
jgi:hypothetical protein